MREAGVLMPVASLPSDYGVGDFGESSYEFVRLLRQAKVTIWQILPLNPLGFGNSPYQPYSSKAGDEIYISLSMLVEDQLLKRVPTYRKNASHIDYDKVRKFKEKYLKLAFQQFKKTKPRKDYLDFIKMDWVYEYAVYLTLKKQNHMVCWNEWPKEQQNWIIDRSYDLTLLKDQIDYEIFVQYEFYRQWMKLKKYANQRQIQIMGDLPIYVGIDSLDVWANQKCFLLDADARPSFVAGVPPDYFSEFGQRWGNPIYDWKYLEQTKFEFWIQRLSYNAQLFDILRIDHFRAFDTYWKIPAECETAVTGTWEEAPGYALFDTVFEKLPNLNLIVEDLGELRPQVYELRDHYHFRGMRIVQFNFEPSTVETSNYEHVKSLVLYTGTHDNQTMVGWYKDQSRKEKARIRRQLKEYGCSTESIAWGFVEFTYKQDCAMAIVPLQDILELSDKARLNTPGTLGSPNWEWKLQNLDLLRKKINQLRKIVK